MWFSFGNVLIDLDIRYFWSAFLCLPFYSLCFLFFYLTFYRFLSWLSTISHAKTKFLLRACNRCYDQEINDKSCISNEDEQTARCTNETVQVPLAASIVEYMFYAENKTRTTIWKRMAKKAMASNKMMLIHVFARPRDCLLKSFYYNYGARFKVRIPLTFFFLFWS